MNFFFNASFHPKAIRSYFTWKPVVTRNHNRGGSWYFNLKWLFFTWQVDNEW